jgi:DNA-binding NtrC family response regulator
MHVLLIDDDVLLTSLLQPLLTEYEFWIANDPIQAKEKLTCSALTSCVIILDMGLPPMPHTPEIGLALLSEIKQHYPQHYVIVLTGQSQPDIAYRALSLGAFDYLTKPVQPEVLRAAIARAGLFMTQEQQQRAQGVHAIAFQSTPNGGLKQVRNEAERQLFVQVWQQSQENVHETARCLGIKRENVYYLLDKYQIRRKTTS